MKIMCMLAGLALLAGLGGAAAVHVEHGGHGPHGAGGAMAVPSMVEWLVDQAVDDVSASDAQRTQLLAVKRQVMSQAEALYGAHEATHAEFKKQWDATTMDAARLHALVDARVEEMRRVLQTAVDGVVQIHDTLTPEQRRTLSERVEAMHAEK